ncbi:exosortase F system-associated membrane protein [Flavobacterium filum]|uniref:exosortase F system-associated membrane protein n=1 Tax=Flavobacterium filum TaxID=370974 RepID=UPI0005505317|nr:exosortase F system-associated protein [Flavobacterium filum]
MDKKNSVSLLNWLLISSCVLLLALIRFFETQLFYDPFIAYFKSDYLQLPFPEFSFFKLISYTLLRYVLNAGLSLAIIYLLFKDVRLTKFAFLLYIILVFLLLIALTILLFFFDEKSNFILFYVRRFLIQPLFLVLFVPAFYFQKRQTD